MKSYEGKTVHRISDETYNDRYDNCSVTIYFTDGTKIEVVGEHDCELIPLMIIEEWSKIYILMERRECNGYKW